MRRSRLFSLLALFAFSAFSDVVVYPDYPSYITRDYAYEVTVTQKDVARPLVVWDRTERSVLTGRTRGGDVHRRFCEFAFSGDPVRVDIRVKEDVNRYAVFPSRLQLKHAFKDGVISVWLTKPTYFGIRLNDYDKTILSVFADKPEDPALIPSQDDPNVLYVSKELAAADPNGQLVVKSPIRQVYIAPGAVLKARLIVAGDKILVNGRGMILDPLSDVFRYDQLQAKTRGLLVVKGRNVTVRDIKLVDARTFNYITWAQNCRMYDVKAMSAMMCTDGFTIGGQFFCDNAWLYVGDNALVISGPRECTIRNVAIGTSCAAIFPQGSFTNTAHLTNIDVFRTDDGLLNNIYNGLLRKVKWHELKTAKADKHTTGFEVDQRPHQSFSLDFQNLSAVDCVNFSRIFWGRNMGRKPKSIRFFNSSFPTPSGASTYRARGKSGPGLFVQNNPKYLFTDNYTLAFTNLWIAGEAVSRFEPKQMIGASNFVVTVGAQPGPQEVPIRPVCEETAYVHPLKVFVGGALYRGAQSPFLKGGVPYLPASIFAIAGGDRSGKADDFVPLSAFPGGVYDPVKGRISIPFLKKGENLVRETAETQSVWQRVPSWLVKMDAMEKDEKGARIYRLSQVEKGAGMQTVITEQILRHGPGRYRLTFEAKAEFDTPFVLTCKLISNDWTLTKMVPEVSSTEWKSFSCVFDVALPEGTDLAALSMTVTQPVTKLLLRNLVFCKE